MIFERLVFEDPYPQMKQDWDNGHYQWREITHRAYQAIAAKPKVHSNSEGFMSAEPTEILRNGEGLHVCCKRKRDHYFARLVPRYDWDELKYYPLPKLSLVKLKVVDYH